MRLLLLAALAAAPLLAACGDAPESTPSTDVAQAPPLPRSPATPAKTPARGGLDFVDGFEAGAKGAASPDEVLLVYVGRHSPT